MNRLKTTFALMILGVVTFTTACNKQSPTIETTPSSTTTIKKSRQQNSGTDVVRGVYTEVPGTSIFFCAENPQVVCYYVVKAIKTRLNANTVKYNPAEGEEFVEYTVNEANGVSTTKYCNYLISTTENGDTKNEVY